MRLQWVVTLILLLGLGAGLSQAGQMPTPGENIPIEFIRVKQVAQLLNDGAKVMLIDVRSRQDYLIRHIKGALSVPLESIDVRSREIPRDGLVVLY
jgi:Rhodanese-like domain